MILSNEPDRQTFERQMTTRDFATTGIKLIGVVFTLLPIPSLIHTVLRITAGLAFVNSDLRHYDASEAFKPLMTLSIGVLLIFFNKQLGRKLVPDDDHASRD